MRLDKPELPFKDIRVRRALTMAIDYSSIARDYYGGNAEILTSPLAPIPEWMNIYTPIEKLPESSRELFGYNPEKAKQLLAEAGYPTGFKTEILCYQAQVDMLSIVKDYWAKIGVDLALDLKEYTVYSSAFSACKFTQMAAQRYYNVNPGKMNPYKAPGGGPNFSFVNDPYIQERFAQYWAFENRENYALQDRLVKEVALYAIDQCWYIQTPRPYLYRFWWPWVKGYNGEWNVGFGCNYNFPIYIWYDQALKKAMGH